MAATPEEGVPEITIDGSTTEQKQAPSEQPQGEASVPVQVGRRRQKVPLAPGHTLAHWNALVMSRKRNTPNVKITPKDLALHKSQSDAWVSLNGKVFDVSKYMDYHPGGMYPLEERLFSIDSKKLLTFRIDFLGVGKLMQVAGSDATSTFYKYHSWVNYESLLAADCVGYLVPDVEEE